MQFRTNVILIQLVHIRIDGLLKVILCHVSVYTWFASWWKHVGNCEKYVCV